MKTTKLFKFDVIKILKGDKSERIFHHKGFSDNKCVDFVSLLFEYVFLRVVEVLIGLITHTLPQLLLDNEQGYHHNAPLI